MSDTHEELVDRQFGPRATAYVESAVHAQGEDLEALAAIAGRAEPRHALDLGTGGGHVAYRLAAHAARVTAADLSADMLAVVADNAAKRGLGNIETVEAAVEKLPFEDGGFDFVATRYSAHHWRDFEMGLREARRVTRCDAPAVFMDSYSPAAGLLDTHLQTVELLRDPSHVRDRTVPEWFAALSSVGFLPVSLRSWRLRMDFPVWTARMNTPEESKRMIRALQQGASSDVRRHFAIEEDGSFLLDVMMIDARAA